NFFPDLFVSGIFFDVGDTNGIDLFRSSLIYWLNFRVSWRAPALRHRFLPLLAGYPARIQERRVRMRSVLENSCPIDRSDTFAQHIVDGRALLDPARIVMGI